MKPNFTTLISFNGGDADDGSAPKRGLPQPAFQVNDRKYLTVWPEGNKMIIRLNLESHPDISDYNYKRLKVYTRNLSIADVIIQDLGDGRISGWMITDMPNPRERGFLADNQPGGTPEIIINKYYKDIEIYLPGGSDTVYIDAEDLGGNLHPCGSQTYNN